MANLFALTIPDSAAALLVTYGAGALIRVQSSPTSGGVYGNVTTIAIVTGVSVYAVYDPDGLAGYSYKYRYEASGGAPAGSYSSAFQPVPGRGGLYATASELKRFARIPNADTDDDAEIVLALDGASRAIDRACRRQFGKVAASETRYYTARYSSRRGRHMVEVDDLYDNSATLTSDGDAVTDFAYEPRNAELDGRPFTSLVFGEGVSVSTTPNDIAVASAVFGWSAVPSAIKSATLLQASRLFKRRDAPFGVTGSPEMGSELRLLARLDPDVDVLIRPYYRWWGAIT